MSRNCDRCAYCDFATTRLDKLKDHELKLHHKGSPPGKRLKIADYRGTYAYEYELTRYDYHGTYAHEYELAR